MAPTSEIIPPPELSPKGGVYEEALTMEIRSSHPAAVIRYTTDGSLPGSVCSRGERCGGKLSFS